MAMNPAKAASVVPRTFTHHRSTRERNPPRLLAASLCPVAVLGWAFLAEARVARIEITSVEWPTFEGRTFGRVGAYEKLRGKAFGEVDPDDPRNAVITRHPPRAAQRETARSNTRTDIYILKPVDLDNGNHRLFMEVNNRGGKLFGRLNNSPGGNNPTTADDAGEGFFMERGYTLVWSGWEALVQEGNDRLTLTVPVATNDGETITGPSYEYINFDNATTETYTLAFPAATLDKGRASLTVNGPRRPAGPHPGERLGVRRRRRSACCGRRPLRAEPYLDFTYTAKDPLVLGLGLAATHDLVSFLGPPRRRRRQPRPAGRQRPAHLQRSPSRSPAAT